MFVGYNWHSKSIFVQWMIRTKFKLLLLTKIVGRIFKNKKWHKCFIIPFVLLTLAFHVDLVTMREIFLYQSLLENQFLRIVIFNILKVVITLIIKLIKKFRISSILEVVRPNSLCLFIEIVILLPKYPSRIT